MDNQSLAFYIIKRLTLALIISVCLLFGTNMAWLCVFSQYDFETVTVEQSTESGGDCMYNNEGELSNGETSCENNENEEEVWNCKTQSNESTNT